MGSRKPSSSPAGLRIPLWLVLLVVLMVVAAVLWFLVPRDFTPPPTPASPAAAGSPP